MDFFNDQPTKVREKIDYVLFLITVAERIPQKFFQHIEGQDGLYEIRIEFQSNIYRIFCCFDHHKLVILFNGFQKKSQKTPKSELHKAAEIMKAYLKEKRKASTN
jgi:phage-related protein